MEIEQICLIYSTGQRRGREGGRAANYRRARGVETEGSSVCAGGIRMKLSERVHRQEDHTHTDTACTGHSRIKESLLHLLLVSNVTKQINIGVRVRVTFTITKRTIAPTCFYSLCQRRACKFTKPDSSFSPLAMRKRCSVTEESFIP